MKHAARVLRAVRVLSQGTRTISAARRRPLYYQHDASHLPLQQEWAFIDSNFPRSSIASDSFTTSRNFYSSLANSLPSSVEEDGHRSAESCPMAVYERGIASGHLKPGYKYQKDALRALQALYDVLHSAAEEVGLERNSNKAVKSSGGWFSYLMPNVQWHAQPSVRGLYLYGGVGTGKTMLMDMFFGERPKTWRKKRIHFHDFIREVHSQLQEVKEDEDEQVKGHRKQGANDSSSQTHQDMQTVDTGRGASSQKPFIRDEVLEPEILMGDENAMKISHDNELGSAREEARREVGWSEMGWNLEEILNWPNAISMARLLSGPLLSWMILHELWSPAFVGLVIAGISDWLDGYVARKMDINSVLGSYLDPVADKFLVGSVATSMAYMGLLHPALVGLIVARDGVLMGGAFIYRAYSLRWQWKDWQEFFRISIGGAGKVEPLFISKVNTVFQLALVGVALLQPALSVEDTYSIVPVLSWSVVVTTSISWLAYAYIYLKNPESLAALKRVAHAPSPKAQRGSS